MFIVLRKQSPFSLSKMFQNSKIMEKLEIDNITTEGNIRWGLVKSVPAQFSLHSVLILRIRFSRSSSFSMIIDESRVRKSTDYRSQLCLSWGLAAIIWLAVDELARTSVEPTLLLKINWSHLRDPTPRIFFAVEKAIYQLSLIHFRKAAGEPNLTCANNSASRSLDRKARLKSRDDVLIRGIKGNLEGRSRED